MSTPVELAQEAKTRGNAAFAKATLHCYKEAVKEFSTATELDPTDHILFANLGAALLEQAKKEYDKSRKVEMLSRALLASRRCTELDAAWPKGWMRAAASEFDLVAARASWKIKDEWDNDAATQSYDVDADGEAKPKVACPEESLIPVIEGATYSSCEASCRTGLATDPAPPAAVADQLRARLQSLRDMGWATDEAADRLIVDTEASLAPKAEGNTAFSAKHYKDAAAKYSAALALNPFDHVFYSNRSACHAGLDEPKEALRDADACVKLAPAFAKGHGRRATALYMMGSYVESEAAAQAGLAVEPDNAALTTALATAKTETCETLAVQAQMHKFREEKKKNDKMKAIFSSLNMGGMGGGGGPGFQMFTPGMMGGGTGGGGLAEMLGGGFSGNTGGNSMSETQMRQLARGMATAETAAPAASVEAV